MGPQPACWACHPAAAPPAARIAAETFVTEGSLSTRVPLAAAATCCRTARQCCLLHCLQPPRLPPAPNRLAHLLRDLRRQLLHQGAGRVAGAPDAHTILDDLSGGQGDAVLADLDREESRKKGGETHGCMASTGTRLVVRHVRACRQAGRGSSLCGRGSLRGSGSCAPRSLAPRSSLPPPPA